MTNIWIAMKYWLLDLPVTVFLAIKDTFGIIATIAIAIITAYKLLGKRN